MKELRRRQAAASGRPIPPGSRPTGDDGGDADDADDDAAEADGDAEADDDAETDDSATSDEPAGEDGGDDDDAPAFFPFVVSRRTCRPTNPARSPSAGRGAARPAAANQTTAVAGHRRAGRGRASVARAMADSRSGRA